MNLIWHKRSNPIFISYCCNIFRFYIFYIHKNTLVIIICLFKSINTYIIIFTHTLWKLVYSNWIFSIWYNICFNISLVNLFEFSNIICVTILIYQLFRFFFFFFCNNKPFRHFFLQKNWNRFYFWIFHKSFLQNIIIY